jgi:hypothetical protein
MNTVPFRSKHHSDRIAASLIEKSADFAQLEISYKKEQAQRKAERDWQDGDPDNTYEKGSIQYNAYQDKWVDMYLQGFASEQGVGE